jgi:hypothetical protein
LVNELRNFNDVAESNPTILNEKFFQEYGWTVKEKKIGFYSVGGANQVA